MRSFVRLVYSLLLPIPTSFRTVVPIDDVTSDIKVKRFQTILKISPTWTYKGKYLLYYGRTRIYSRSIVFSYVRLSVFPTWHGRSQIDGEIRRRKTNNLLYRTVTEIKGKTVINDDFEQTSILHLTWLVSGRTIVVSPGGVEIVASEWVSLCVFKTRTGFERLDLLL